MKLQLQDLEDLAEEVRAAVQAGVPLERGLSAAAAGHGRRLRLFLQRLQAGLQSGESLESIVAGTTGGAGRLLAAAVAAGLKTGRPALMLEMLGAYAGDVIELRAGIAQAMAYPVAVMATALVLLAGGMQIFLERYLEAAVIGLGVMPGEALLRFLLWNRDYSWWVFVPAGMFAGVLLLWLISGRAASLRFRGPERLLLLLPGLGKIVEDLQNYTLTRMLSLLLQHELALPDALTLAGAAAGSVRLERACRGVALEVSQGQTAAGPGSAAAAALPPLLRASLAQTAGHEQRLAIRLQSTAGFYRQRYERGMLWLRLLMPAVLLLVLGGGCALAYGLLIFWPILELYHGLAVTLQAPVFSAIQSAVQQCLQLLLCQGGLC
ncbi:MAG: type II secretion system F family protein [Actinomycetota bacterium]